MSVRSRARTGTKGKLPVCRRTVHRSPPRLLSALLALPLLAAGGASAYADAAAGQRTFAQCAGCHAVGPGAAHRVGPHLNGLMERGAGAADGYAYSAAFVSKVDAGLVWNEETLGAYLEAPAEFIPGTRMAYPGLKSAEERANVIAYLGTIGPDGAIPELVADAERADAEERAAVSGTALPDEQPPPPLAREVPVPEHGVLHLGRRALEEEVAAWDIDVRPDGTGLPAGRGTVEAGTELYDAQCAACHGVFGEGEGRWPMLAGGWDTLTDERPEKTIGSYWPYLSTVYDYVRRAMPFGNARSLSDDDVYALTAYLLYLNDVVDESFELSAENFTDVEMPNAGNFIADTRDEEPWFEMAGEPCMSDCREGEATVVQRARVLDVTPGGEGGDDGAEGID